MSFLPEEDRNFLADKQIKYREHEESNQRGLIIEAMSVPGHLRALVNGVLCAVKAAEILVMIPAGYNTARLDSFYTRPHLKRVDGSPPNCATGSLNFATTEWQFWSRHLDENVWRPGVDGMEMYLQLIRRALETA